MAFTYTCLSVLLVFTCITFALGSRPYEIKIDRFEEYPGLDNSYADCSKLVTTKFNRTTMVVNGTITILKPIPSDGITLHGIGNELIGTNYVPSITTPPQKMCEFLETDKFIISQIVAHSNGSWNGKCPIDVKEVHIINLIFDEDNFPEQFPGDKWRLDGYGMLNGKIIGGYRGYITVDRMKELRKKAGPMG